MPYQRTSLFVIIAASRRLLLTIKDLFLWNDNALCSGVEPVQERADEPGKKLALMHILRIRGLNGGTDTEIRKTLLLMSFEESLTSLTCSGGWTGTRSTWRLKEVVGR